MRSSIISTISAATVFAVSATALAADWEVDASHSSAQFAVKHMMISNVRGEFPKLTGTFNENESDVTKSKAEFTIDASSINTHDEKRDAHLKGEDFFDVKNHPNITFKSTKVQKAGKEKLKVTGDLTIRGVTKPTTFEVTLSPKAVKDPWGNLKKAASGTATINRLDYDLKWNKALETGGVLVGNEVKLDVELELNQKPSAPPASQG
jgi:polyisoprenoid-binding protein YceI